MVLCLIFNFVVQCKGPILMLTGLQLRCDKHLSSMNQSFIGLSSPGQGVENFLKGMCSLRTMDIASMTL